MQPSVIGDFPGSVRLPAGRSPDGFGPPVDGDGLGIFPAIAPLPRLIRPRRRHGAAMATVRIAPARYLVGRGRFQRGLGIAFHGELIGAIKGFSDLIAEIKAKTKTILIAERTALNFLNHASGIATLTYQFKQKVNKKTKIC